LLCAERLLALAHELVGWPYSLEAPSEARELLSYSVVALLYKDRQDLRKRPLSLRRAMLEATFRQNFLPTLIADLLPSGKLVI
jgi:hypothetical protein